MAINMDVIKSRLTSLQNTGKKTSKVKDFIWKPTPGKQVVRIVPYQHQPDNPFMELKFHYGFAGKNYLSPASFNKPDPIVELSEKLKKSGDKDQWKTGRSLEPKMRTYVPIIVRGEEEKGVKFWGFGVSVYKQIMEAMSDSDYGDITDLNSGYDITVDFKTAQEVGKDYPETTILIKPKPRPVIDNSNPKHKELLNKITTQQPNILDVYEVASYETLSKALEDFLKKDAQGKEDTEESAVVEPTEKQIEDGKATVSVSKIETIETPSPSAQKAVSNSMEELTKTFDNLFNNA